MNKRINDYKCVVCGGKDCNVLLEKWGFEAVSLKFSPVPNEWVRSVNMLLKDKAMPRMLIDFFRIDNPVCLIAFMPLILSEYLFGHSTRFEIIAKKT